MSSTIFENTLPNKTKLLVEKLQSIKPTFLESFYLSGGTGLSLQIGHRESEDLDFFTNQQFNPQALESEIVALGEVRNTEISSGTLNTFVDGVQLQLLRYDYPLLEDIQRWDGIRLSSTLDIGCTKLQTASMRGSKKDFIDLFFLLEQFSLPELLEKAQQKYAAVDYNQAHILKSLVYFEEAEGQPMPRMIKPASWQEVKDRLIAEVKQISF